MCKLNAILNEFNCRKIYTDLLHEINDWQKRNVTDGKANLPVIIELLKTAPYNYMESTTQEAAQDLIHSGHLQNSQRSSNISITDSGKKYLQECHQFKMQGIPAKLTKIIQSNFAGILSLISLFFSFVSLLLSVFHHH